MPRPLELYVYLRKKGLRETLARLRLRYLSIVTFVLYGRPTGPDVAGLEPDPDCVIREGSLDELERIREATPGLPREFYVDRTHGGRHFFIAYVNGKAAHIHWIFARGDYSRFFRIDSPATVEVNYISTVPGFEGRRLQAKVLNFACRELHRAGYQRIVSAVSIGNVPSIKGMERAGLREIRRVGSYFGFAVRTLV